MRELLQSFSKLELYKVKKYIQRYAVSSLGKERIEAIAPSSLLPEIRHSLSLVSEMKRMIEEALPPPLDNITDLRTNLQRTSIENFVLSSDELHSIVRLLTTSRNIHVFFGRVKQTYPFLYETISSIYVDKILEYNINQAIDENGQVKDSANKELGSIRKQIVEYNEMLRNRLQGILKAVTDKEWIQEDIITTREGRMVIPIKSEHKNRVPGFIHSTSASGATVFVEPTETLDLNNEIRTLQFREKREIEKILRLLTQQVQSVRQRLSDNIELLAELDLIQAKAKYSLEIMGSEPILTNENRLRLVNARHPVLLQKHKWEEVVPLNFEVTHEINTVVITGPNAGGKSVALKTVGLLCLLVQSGCHIPAGSESELPVFTDYFVDIGDEQSIENDLSSFSSHLRNLREILENANATSLVLIDEIASGTDPVEGASLASAVLEQLTLSGCKTIATTHHGALKVFAFETQGIINAAMEFDQGTLKPTYRYRSGIPGSSYALEMAERMSLPHRVLDRARHLRGSESNNLEKLILDLEQKSQLLTQQLVEVRSEKNRFESLAKDYSERISLLQKESKAMKLKALTEAELIVSRSKSAIEKTIREIKEHAAERTIVKAAKEEVRFLEEDIRNLRNEIEPSNVLPVAFAPGESVKLKGTTTTGTIAETLDDGYYLVVVGSLKLRVSQTDLDRNDQNTRLAASPGHPHEYHGNLQRELDLRGMYVDEAIQAIEKFFDSALLSGLHRVDIIHGKGTGALRKKVTEYLKNNSSVKSFRLGEWNEGGTGVTVVELA